LLSATPVGPSSCHTTCHDQALTPSPPGRVVIFSRARVQPLRTGSARHAGWVAGTPTVGYAYRPVNAPARTPARPGTGSPPTKTRSRSSSARACPRRSELGSSSATDGRVAPREDLRQLHVSSRRQLRAVLPRGPTS
jgi:hypothetical protein